MKTPSWAYIVVSVIEVILFLIIARMRFKSKKTSGCYNCKEYIVGAEGKGLCIEHLLFINDESKVCSDFKERD